MAKYSESKEDLLWDPAMMAEVPDQDGMLTKELYDFGLTVFIWV